MLKFMLFSKNHKMSLVGRGLAVDHIRRDLTRVRARISQKGPGLWPNNSHGEAALVFTCGCQVAVAADYPFSGGSMSDR